MNASLAIALLIGLAFVLANLPFLTENVCGVIRLAQPKHVGWHLIELLIYYTLTGVAAFAMERQVGQVAPQTWEFYAITGALFLTFAFPGFVYRHLWKHH